MNCKRTAKPFVLLGALLMSLLGLMAETARAQGNCSTSGADWLSTYQMQENYMPGTPLCPTSTATKAVHMSIHVWRPNSGDSALFATQLNRDSLRRMVEHYMPDYYSQVNPPSIPVPGYTYSTYTDTKIRFIVDSVYFNDDSQAFYYSNLGPGAGGWLTNRAIQLHPECERTLNFHRHLVGSVECPNWIALDTCIASGGSGYAQPPTLGSFSPHSWLGMSPISEYTLSIPPFVGGLRPTVAHELAHILGLRHLYGGAAGLEECSSSNAQEFLFDIFGDGTFNPSWFLPPQGSCNVGMYAACYTNQPPGNVCPNNIMGVGAPEPWVNITPLQMGRMHRNLMVANIAKYAWGYDPVDYVLTANETWDFPIKFYQDIVVPAGVTLTVKCELHMVPQAQIVVQPGGKLVVDGGRIQAALFAPARWRGIQVNGNPGMAQTDANQGVVELRNGAVIADAIVGIAVGGGTSTTGNGGIVRSNGGLIENSFVNCRRAVHFFPYIYTSSNLNVANASYFRRTRFEVNPDFMEYPGGLPFVEHVRLSRVFGLAFRTCTFINTRTASTSLELGHGIRSQDSHFFVNGVCRFEGLDHGINASATQAWAWCDVQTNVFKNNICGVYTSGLAGCRIIGNRFIMGLRNVSLTGIPDIQFQNYHRGIFTHESYKFTIQRNVLQRDADPLAATRPCEGIVVGYNRDYGDVLRSNRAIQLNRGFVGEGVNCSTTGYASVFGLQFKCNECQNTSYNIWSRPDASMPQPVQATHSIRTLQGSLTSLTDNKHDNWLFGSIGKDDFRVSNPAMPVKYMHRSAAPFAPTDWDFQGIALPWLITQPPTNSCPVISEPPFGLAPQEPSLSQLELENEKLAYGNVRYQYEQLIDGGNTDEVVEEIVDAWPQDFLDLRAYLLAKSPYLSVDALKQAMDKPGFPDAIRAEICIANPEGTQKEGFIKWLQLECTQPLPPYLIASIMASWDVNTYRSTLEAQMAGHSEGYTAAATEWSDHYLADSVQVPLDSLLRIWQEVRTPAARYAEANLYLDRGAYIAAQAVINGLPLEHKLKTPEVLEQQRMLDWIGFVQSIRSSSRSLEYDLTAAEVDQLESLIGDEQDRPAIWISNLLCFHYERCRMVHTGGEEEGGAKDLSVPSPTGTGSIVISTLTLVPNPASNWLSITYAVPLNERASSIVIQDLTGRVVHQATIAGSQGQMVWDCRAIPAGTYTCRLYAASGARLAVELAVIHP